MAFAGPRRASTHRRRAGDGRGRPRRRARVAGLFAEELGAVLQVRAGDRPRAMDDRSRATACRAAVGAAERRRRGPRRTRWPAGVYAEIARALQRAWSETTWQMQSLRDNPACAQQEYDRILDVARPRPARPPDVRPARTDVAAPFIARGARPPIAILRDQGVNGEVEMAAAFDRAGFEAHDVHMSDIIAGRVSLAGFRGLAACGGFSFGDVLGGGEGWAKSALYNARARDEFSAFFARPRHLRARRVQRLPDDGGDEGADPRRRGVAAIREERVRAVRGAAGDGGGAAEPVDLLPRDGGQPASRSSRRTARDARRSTRRPTRSA